MLNSLPNDKILDMSKFKASVDDKIDATEKKNDFFLRRIQNIVGKGENAAYQHFLRFPKCFPKGSSTRLLKVRIAWLKVKGVRFRSLKDFVTTPCQI